MSIILWSVFVLIIVVSIVLVFEHRRKWSNVKRFGEWAESNRFLSESIRTMVFGFLGTLALATIFELLRISITRISEVDKARLSFKTDAIKDFTEKSYRFTSVAVRHSEGEQLPVGHTLRDAYDDFRIAQQTLTLVFRENDDLLKLWTKQLDTSKMMDLINHYGGVKGTPKEQRFEEIRREIKKSCDAVEVEAMKNL